MIGVGWPVSNQQQYRNNGSLIMTQEIQNYTLIAYNIFSENKWK